MRMDALGGQSNTHFGRDAGVSRTWGHGRSLRLHAAPGGLPVQSQAVGLVMSLAPASLARRGGFFVQAARMAASDNAIFPKFSMALQGVSE